MIIRCKKTKVTKMQVDANTTEPEDEVSYATMSFPRKVDRSTQGDDDGDSVIYSKVKAPSSSAGASSDPNMFYATINHPDK
ncbi:hypothetical protein Q5P01_004632 [Channa striata]|uniref:Uncharacterized protein n=1 Tax=Channa striata TaxID=64152 RepID=A0AA88T6J2_CHASR|nr:hypothetical protein Q5P01_004632 [Channa striata]